MQTLGHLIATGIVEIFNAMFFLFTELFVLVLDPKTGILMDPEIKLLYDFVFSIIGSLMLVSIIARIIFSALSGNLQNTQKVFKDIFVTGILISLFGIVIVNINALGGTLLVSMQANMSGIGNTIVSPYINYDTSAVAYAGSEENLMSYIDIAEASSSGDGTYDGVAHEGTFDYVEYVAEGGDIGSIRSGNMYIKGSSSIFGSDSDMVVPAYLLRYDPEANCSDTSSDCLKYMTSPEWSFTEDYDDEMNSAWPLVVHYNGIFLLLTGIFVILGFLITLGNKVKDVIELGIVYIVGIVSMIFAPWDNYASFKKMLKEAILLSTGFYISIFMFYAVMIVFGAMINLALDNFSGFEVLFLLIAIDFGLVYVLINGPDVIKKIFNFDIGLSSGSMSFLGQQASIAALNRGNNRNGNGIVNKGIKGASNGAKKAGSKISNSVKKGTKDGLESLGRNKSKTGAVKDGLKSAGKNAKSEFTPKGKKSPLKDYKDSYQKGKDTSSMEEHRNSGAKPESSSNNTSGNYDSGAKHGARASGNGYSSAKGFNASKESGQSKNNNYSKPSQPKSTNNNSSSRQNPSANRTNNKVNNNSNSSSKISKDSSSRTQNPAKRTGPSNKQMGEAIRYKKSKKG